MNRAGIATAVLLSGLSWNPVLAQEASGGLRGNPFNRPDYAVALDKAPAPVSRSAARPAELELRATLLSDGHALADINGEILSTGQTFEGHRIMYIAEGRVVLSKGGVQVVLDLYENQVGSDAEDD